MQRSKHLSQTLGFSALLVLMTVQATGVDSVPSDASALTSGEFGTQLRNGKSPRSIGEPIKGDPGYESLSETPPAKLTVNIQERPVSKTRGEVPVSDASDHSFHGLVSIALGSLAGYKDTLTKAIMQNIDDQIAAPLQASGILLHHRETEKYESTNGETGPSKGTSVLVSLFKRPFLQVDVNKRRPVRRVRGKVPSSRAANDSFSGLIGTALVRLDGDRQALRKAILQIIKETDARSGKGDRDVGYHRKFTNTRDKNLAVF